MAATEIRSETPSLVVGPRISFSYNLSQYDVVPVEPQPQPHSKSNSSVSDIDFNFSIRESSFDHESSSADELFSDGRLLPSRIRTKPIIPLPNPTHQSATNPENSKTEETEEDSKALSEEKLSNTKSFWPFKRSSSVSGGGGYGRAFCPLPLLSRSHSTGSAMAGSSKTQFSKQNWQRNIFSAASQSSSSKAQGNMSGCSGGNHLKPPLKKKGYGGYGKGVRVNPILNVPSGNLFGLGSIFSNGKDKNKKK